MQLIKKIKIARLKKNRDRAILSIGPIRSKSPFFIFGAVGMVDAYGERGSSPPLPF